MVSVPRVPDVPDDPRSGGDPAAPLTLHDAESVARLSDRLAVGRIRLAEMPVEERILAIDRVAAGWLSNRSPFRRHALATLPATTGYPRRAIAIALDNLWAALRASDLRSVVGTEGLEAAEPARLAFHVLSGNVPGAGVFGIVGALLAGVASLVKTAAREPLLPFLVAQSLAAEDERLGAALAVAHWGRDDSTLTGTAIDHADVVLAYGNDQSLDAIAARRPRRLLRYGPRLSVGLIATESVDARTARQAALQVALFDQQGCLSPQLVLVEDAYPARTASFAAALAAELAELATSLPAAGTLSLPEATAVWRYRERQRWRVQEGDAVTLHDDPDGRYSVACDRTGTIARSPLNRHVTVVPIASLDDARATLLPFAGSVEAVGFAGPSSRVREAAAVGASCGAARLCPIDRMQAPPFGWRQSGHARLGSFAEPSVSTAGAAGAW